MATSPEPPQSCNNPCTPFAELHCKSNFSFLTGASHPEELVKKAHALGYEAIAITDECSLAGIVKAHVAAKEVGMHLVVGSEFQIALEDGEFMQLVLLSPTLKAYRQLSSVITFARRRMPKGRYELSLDDLNAVSDTRIDQCHVLWMPRNLSITELLAQGRALLERIAKPWLALELFLQADDLDRTANVLTLAMELELPIVASNAVHMHVQERKALLDTLAAIRLKTPVDQLGTESFINCEHHLRPIERLKQLYPPELLEEAASIARSCTFSLDRLRYQYPEELVPEGRTPALHLRQLTYEGAALRYPNDMPESVRELLDKELRLIAELNFEYYFLTVHDIVRFARDRGILCQGRGSAANSAVCYCLHITEVDPDKASMLFERFVSKERQEPPDIDVDFEHERREEVIQYIYRHYTRDRAALAATLITYRPRSAIRDVGKALGLDLDMIDLLSKSMAWWDSERELVERMQAAGMDPDSHAVQRFTHLLHSILGFPRHLSQHVGGFVISAGPLAHLVPIENAAMPDRTVIQWDKDDLDALALLKIDVLGLGMLTAIRKSMAMVNDFHSLPADRTLTVSRIPPEDPEVYRMLQKADSVGVFQVESRAQMSMLPRLRPECFYDLVIEVAIVRPGPIQGDMVHPYLRRRQNLETVTYSNDGVRRVLERTLGVPIFQEQVIELAMVAAGFSAGEADQLRRAIASWRRKGGLEKFDHKLIEGMLDRGHPLEFAERICQQIRGFGEYGFPESHAASFALLVYISAWLKRHEPAAFCCGLLNSQPMGFYSASQLIQDAQRHDVEIREVDVQRSGWDYRLEPCNARSPKHTCPQGAIRIGMRQIKGLAQETADRIAGLQPFRDIDDLAQRADLNDQTLTFLARAGALKNLTGHRFQAHWDAAGVDRPGKLWKQSGASVPYHTSVRLSAPNTGEDVLSDYRYLGLTLVDHPLSLLSDTPELSRRTTAEALGDTRDGQFVQIAGLVTCRQRPNTSSQVIFLTLEDETGNSNVVVWQSTFKRFRTEILQSQLIRVKGVVEREREVVHVVAGHVTDLSERLGELSRTGPAPTIKNRRFR